MAKPARAYHHGNLRRALVLAALSLVAANHCDFTMRELARAAKVTHNAPYRHFPDRAALLAAIAEEGFAMLSARSRRDAKKRAGDARSELGALGGAYVAFAVEHPNHFRIMFGEALADAKAKTPSLARAAAESFGSLQRAIAACREERILRHDLSTDDLSVVAWSLVHGLASLLVTAQLPRAKAAKLTRQIGVVFFEGALAARTKKSRTSKPTRSVRGVVGSSRRLL